VSPAYDPLAALRDAGLPVDVLSDGQREVLGALTEEEAAVLVMVQERLQAASDEVVAHELKLL
jgi:hypothetical protein